MRPKDKLSRLGFSASLEALQADVDALPEGSSKRRLRKRMAYLRSLYLSLTIDLEQAEEETPR